MSEFYIKSADVNEITDTHEQMVLVTISSFKGRSGVELTAEHDGAVIASERFNLSIGDNTVDFPIPNLTAPRKIMIKLSYRGFPAGSYETDI